LTTLLGMGFVAETCMLILNAVNIETTTEQNRTDFICQMN